MDTPGFTVSQTADAPDLVQIAPGITLRPMLMTRPRDGSSPLPLAALVYFDPGAELHGDHHGDSMEINAVVAGRLGHGGLLLGPGEELRCEVGSTHSPYSPEGGPGAVVVVWFPDRMAQ